MPHIVPPVAWKAPVLLHYSLLAKVHRWALPVGGAALFLHVLGTLKHHFVARSNVLVRMWKGIV